MADQQASDTPGVTGITGETVVGGEPPVANGADKYAPRLPDAVRRAAARAEELQQQMAAESDPVAVEGAQDSQQEHEADPPAPSPQPQHQPQDDWQNRYRTLQGKYDHELPQLRNHIQQLENLIATMQRPAAEPQPQPQQMAQIEIPEEDYTTYGPDFVDSTRRWARAEVQQDIEAMRREIDGLKQYANQTTGDRLKDRVRAELDRDPEIAGQWQHLDTDAGFNAWLNDIDPFSGARRLDMLRSAYASGDAVRTGRFFKAYLQEHTDQTRMPTAASQTPGSVTQYQPVTSRNGSNGHYGNGAGQVDLAAYAAPGRAPNATPGPGAGERRIWTNRDIQAFYEGRLKGRFKGREAEADRLERDILAAAQEGRVSP